MLIVLAITVIAQVVGAEVVSVSGSLSDLVSISVCCNLIFILLAINFTYILWSSGFGGSMGI